LSNNEVQVLTDIRERIVRLETKIDAMTDVRETAEEAKETAHEAAISSRSAHKRLDEILDNQKWLWRTVVGAIIAVVIAAISKINGG